MSKRRSQPVGWIVVVGVLAAVVGGAGIATAALGQSSGRTDPRAHLSATNFDDADVAERMGIPTTITRTDAPATQAVAVTAVPTTRTAPVTTTIAPRPAVTPTPPPTTASTTTTAPTDWLALLPPRPSPENPPSWSMEANGVSVQLRMTPIAPHVGDTVEFTIDSSITLAGGACCLTSLHIGQEIVYQEMPGPGGCSVPPPPARQEHREGRVSYVITGPEIMAIPGPLILDVGLSVSRLDPCQVPFGFSGATLNVPVTALYPHH
jgi:hypothetical protein